MYFAAKVSIYLLINKKKQSYFSFFNVFFAQFGRNAYLCTAFLSTSVQKYKNSRVMAN